MCLWEKKTSQILFVLVVSFEGKKKSENKLTENLVLGKLNNIIAPKYQDVTP